MKTFPGNGGGVPDHSVALDTDLLRDLFKSQRERETFNPNAVKSSNELADPQLQKAIEFLQSKLESETG